MIIFQIDYASASVFYLLFVNDMVLIVSILAIVMAIVAGAYSIVLLNNLRKKYHSVTTTSFFYYQILVFTFGVYGILGSHLISKILLKYELNITGIETIALFLPFLGVPFLIAAWYLFIKTSLNLLGKTMPQYLAVIFFALTTCAFLAYGLLMRSMTINTNLYLKNISQMIRISYYSIDVFITIAISLAFLINISLASSFREKSFFRYFAFTAIFIVLIKAISLHFSEDYFLARIYFLLIYFSSSIPLILILKKYSFVLAHNSIVFSASADQILEKYSITSREKEVIEEICKGKSNQQIADDLFISLQTVKDHIHSIFRKTEVKNRVQLVRMFSRIK